VTPIAARLWTLGRRAGQLWTADCAPSACPRSTESSVSHRRQPSMSRPWTYPGYDDALSDLAQRSSSFAKGARRSNLTKPLGNVRRSEPCL